MQFALNSNIDSIVSKIKKHPLLLALILNSFAFIFRILVFDVKYEVSDDYIIDAVLSGAYGNGYDPDLLFGNIILGYFLVFLYKLIPTVSFYFILLITLGFISVTSIVFLLFKRNINAITVCLAIVFICYFTDDLYVLIQFTKVAAASGIAGGLIGADGTKKPAYAAYAGIDNPKTRAGIIQTMNATAGMDLTKTIAAR